LNKSKSLRNNGFKFHVIPKLIGKWNGTFKSLDIEHDKIKENRVAVNKTQKTENTIEQRITFTTETGITTEQHLSFIPISNGKFEIRTNGPLFEGFNLYAMEFGENLIQVDCIEKSSGLKRMIETIVLGPSFLSQIQTITRFSFDGKLEAMFILNQQRLIPQTTSNNN